MTDWSKGQHINGNPPDIVLVVMDTARAQNFSCYGYERNTTPYIDELATESTLFQQAIVPAEWTIPVHASIFTGTYPSRHGAVNKHRFLDNRLTTLAEFLKKLGYHTACFSANDLVSNVTGLTRGFDVIHTMSTGPRMGQFPLTLFTALRAINVLRTQTGGRDHFAWIINWLVQRWLKHQRSDQPFFLFINYMEPHLPHRFIPEPYASMFLPDAVDFKRAKQAIPNYRAFITGRTVMRERDFQMLRALYDADLAYLNSRIRQLINLLDRERGLDRTLLIITSDHGENLGEHNLMHHAYCLYDTLIHVPLLIRYPDVFPSGTVDVPVSSVDIFPTLFDLLDVSPDKLYDQIQGHSLLRSLSGDCPAYVVSELHSPINEFAKNYPEFDFTPLDRELRALRTQTHKYIWTSDGRDELYNIYEDPEELNNLVGIEPEVAGDLRRRLLDWVNAHPNEASTETISAAQEEAIASRLRALGYID